MSDGNYQREDTNKVFLSFEFEGELIDPEQYLVWHQMKEECELQQYLEEYDNNRS